MDKNQNIGRDYQVQEFKDRGDRLKGVVRHVHVDFHLVWKTLKAEFGLYLKMVYRKRGISYPQIWECPMIGTRTIDYIVFMFNQSKTPKGDKAMMKVNDFQKYEVSEDSHEDYFSYI